MTVTYDEVCWHLREMGADEAFLARDDVRDAIAQGCGKGRHPRTIALAIWKHIPAAKVA